MDSSLNLYLEIPKFKKKEEELVTILNKWLYAMKNLSSLMDRPKALVDAVFQRFFEQAEIANFTTQELNDYQESQKDYWDLFSVMETAENKGVVRGIAIGEEREREQQLKKQEQERIASIQSFRKLGISDEQIAAGLNLPLEYVQQH